MWGGHDSLRPAPLGICSGNQLVELIAVVDLDVVGVGSDGRGGEIADLQALNIGPLHRPGVFDQSLLPEEKRLLQYQESCPS